MAAARKRAFRSHSAWRPAAYASINVNWKKMFPDGDRDERLAWIGEYLGVNDLASMTDLTDDQLGAVAGEMKRLTGQPSSKFQVPGSKSGNVVRGDFGQHRDSAGGGKSETVFLSSPEMVYTIEKLITYCEWGPQAAESFLYTRYSVRSVRMLTFDKAKAVLNQFLHIAAHRDLKKRNGQDTPVSRKEINKYIPLLKQQLRIDQ